MKPSKWPSFVTRDLGDTAKDSEEMDRRWAKYKQEMNALIATGEFHLDEDSWWVETATGELVGPDPEVERPMTDEELNTLRPVDEAQRPLANKRQPAKSASKGGRPKSANPKVSTTLRLDPDLLSALRATGKGWQSRANELLRKGMGL
ncbi:BrnA antitoxin family protein [Cognatishimia sp. D5M38]|uniref:BrnA antitoxin family protein n=1 Tax=Cognatishimia coralii TaxID=3083254 RepID=A0ABU8QKS4_9RHOB|nr:BrnA antitoxin family protein [Donghicola eburneus]MCI5040948.1 BrnA antitoxin family protein [Donghicola eburneus]